MDLANMSGSEPTAKQTKKMQKELVKEAKSEEKSLKSTQKDLASSKKAEQKAHKASLKAELKYEKMTKKEKVALKGVHEAERRREVATADLNQAKKDYETSMRHYDQMKELLANKSSRVDTVAQEVNENSQIRNSKLTELKRRLSAMTTGSSGSDGHNNSERPTAIEGVPGVGIVQN